MVLSRVAQQSGARAVASETVGIYPFLLEISFHVQKVHFSRIMSEIRGEGTQFSAKWIPAIRGIRE